MSNVWFTSDLHIGHKNLGRFRHCIPQEFIDLANGDHCEANTLWLRYWWDKLVKKRDTVHCLGDNAFTEEGVDEIATWKGRKLMYGGNHDDLQASIYLRAFENVRGCMKLRKGRGWVSHFPLHDSELRGHFCNHGHLHFQQIDDYRYINVCCDNLFVNIGRPLISLAELDKVRAIRKEKKIVTWEGL